MSSFVTDAKSLVKRYVPTRLLDAIVQTRGRLRVGPHHAPPVVQPFFADGTTRSYARLHNFYSTLVPGAPTEAIARVRLYDGAGRVAVERRYRLAHMASRAVDLRALLDDAGHRVDVGVVTCLLLPTRPWRAAYRTLGLVTSHFFVQHVESSGSLGMVHPLATEVAGEPTRTPFRSSQLVTTRGLQRVELLTYNPTHGPHRAVASLRAVDGREVVAQRFELGPMSARLVMLDVPSHAPEQLCVEVDALPAPNAKPVLRRRFTSGLSSMSHA